MTDLPAMSRQTFRPRQTDQLSDVAGQRSVVPISFALAS
jgi:hypothetical protein